MPSTTVDGDIICDVAQKHGMGAGGLKGLLTMPGVDKLSDREQDAIDEAYERQAERNGVTLTDPEAAR